MKKLHSIVGKHNERERRLLHMSPIGPGGGIDKLQSVNDNAFAHEEFKKWKKETPGAQEIFDALEQIKTPTIEDVRGYLEDRQEQGKSADFDEELRTKLETVDDPAADSKERLKAEHYLKILVEYIQKRNVWLKESRDKMNSIMDQPELPGLTNTMWEGTKDTVAACVEGFKEASGKEKVLMLAGTVAGFLMLRMLWNEAGKIPGSSGMKKILKFGLGAGVTWMAFEAVNKTLEKTRGRPLVNWHGWLPETPAAPFNNIWNRLPGQTQEQWDAEVHQNEIDRIANELRRMEVPEDFLKDMPSENANYVFGIANLSTLSVDIFEKLYESGKSSRSIADGNSLYPQRPKRDDKKSKLSPVERFALVQKVGQTLGLIDTQGDFVLPEDENRRNKSLLYLMLDWDQ